MQDKCDSRMHRAVYLAYLRRKTQALALVPAFQNGVVDCTYSRNLGRRSRIQRSRRWEDLKREKPLYPHISFKSLRKIATGALFRNVFSKNTYMIRSRDFFRIKARRRGESTPCNQHENWGNSGLAGWWVWGSASVWGGWPRLASKLQGHMIKTIFLADCYKSPKQKMG